MFCAWDFILVTTRNEGSYINVNIHNAYVYHVLFKKKNTAVSKCFGVQCPLPEDGSTTLVCNKTAED